MSDDREERAEEHERDDLAPIAEAAPAAEPEAEKIEDLVDEKFDLAVSDWLNSLRGGPIAQNTNCWNALNAALPKLKSSLHRHIAGE